MLLLAVKSRCRIASCGVMKTTIVLQLCATKMDVSDMFCWVSQGTSGGLHVQATDAS